jgi:hypothetical protein
VFFLYQQMIVTHLVDDGDIRSPLSSLLFASKDAAHSYMSAEFGDTMSYLFDDELQAQLDASDHPNPAPGCF